MPHTGPWSTQWDCGQPLAAPGEDFVARIQTKYAAHDARRRSRNAAQSTSMSHRTGPWSQRWGNDSGEPLAAPGGQRIALIQTNAKYNETSRNAERSEWVI